MNEKIAVILTMVFCLAMTGQVFAKKDKREF